MTLDVLKVRTACLRLIGMRRDDSLGFFGGPLSNWRGSDGEQVFEKDVPDPTKYIDHAIAMTNVVPMELILGGFDGYFKVIGYYQDGTTTDSEGFYPKDSIAMAMCIVALQCSGRDIGEFEA